MLAPDRGLGGEEMAKVRLEFAPFLDSLLPNFVRVRLHLASSTPFLDLVGHFQSGPSSKTVHLHDIGA